MFRKLIVAAPCILGAVFCLYRAWSLQPVHTPELWTAQSKLDFGELYQGQIVHQNVELVNRFQQPMDILDVITGCGCTVATPSTNHLGPGEQLVVEIKWATGRARGPTAVLVRVIYRLADKSIGQSEIRVQGHIIPDILYHPAELAFPPREASTRVVKLLPGRKAKFTILKASCNHIAFQTVVREGSCVEVSFDPSKWVATDRSLPQLLVDTDSENDKTIVVPLIVARDE